MKSNGAVEDESANRPDSPNKQRAQLRQARSRQTRQALIDAAEALWRERPIDDVTVTDICDATGVAIGSLYFHFGRKEDLLLEVALGNAYRSCVATYEDLDATQGASSWMIGALLSTLARHLSEVPTSVVAAAMLEAYRVMGQARGDARSRVESVLFETFIRVFRRAQSQNELPANVPPDDLAIVTTTVVQQTVLAWAVAQQPTDLRALLVRFVNLTLRGVGIEVR